MKLRISEEQAQNWQRDLTKAGRREIGGVLFGEQIAEGEFRLIDVTRQRFGGGTEVRFHRRGGSAKRAIEALHKMHGGDAERYNYLGEWHSHPNAPALPSPRDEVTMYQLLADQGDAVNFLVLLIVRLGDGGALEIGAITYLASGHKIPVSIVIERPVADTIEVQNKEGRS